MTKTYSISVVIDDEAPLFVRREQARIAALSFYDNITGDGERRVKLLTDASAALVAGKDAPDISTELSEASLCQ